jgi:hypothetical protein
MPTDFFNGVQRCCRQHDSMLPHSNRLYWPSQISPLRVVLCIMHGMLRRDFTEKAPFSIDSTVSACSETDTTSPSPTSKPLSGSACTLASGQASVCALNMMVSTTTKIAFQLGCRLCPPDDTILLISLGLFPRSPSCTRPPKRPAM